MLKEKELTVSLLDIVFSFSKTIDLISPAMSNHHIQTAYISGKIAEALGMPIEEKRDLISAAALHDIGALYIDQNLLCMDFEDNSIHQHAEAGHLLLNMFPPMAQIAKMIQYHHLPWKEAKILKNMDKTVLLGSQIIQLADRISLSIKKCRDIIGLGKRCYETISTESGNLFSPQLVEIFGDLSQREYFWLETLGCPQDVFLHIQEGLNEIPLQQKELFSLAKMFSHMIDFRSRFTATHSTGVMIASSTLARLANFSEEDCELMKIAGYFHDLGKMAIPKEILEKPGKLTEEEFNIIRCHPFYTYQTLKHIKALQNVNEWASYHHEREDGKGYPFGPSDGNLPTGSRVMSVADVFTALTEDRPYRKGMEKKEVIEILCDMSKKGGLNKDLVFLLVDHYEEINQLRMDFQEKAIEEYRNLMPSTEGIRH